MTSDLAKDDDFVEACRLSAWAEKPGFMAYWDSVDKKFNFPETNWPEGVKAEEYVRAQVYSPKPSAVPIDESNLSPSVRKLRSMINA